MRLGRAQKSLRRGRRGAALVAVLWIIIALIAVVFVMAKSMTVEALAVKQHIAMAKADAAERGVEQYVLSCVASEIATPGYIDLLTMERREIGECYFWVITPDLSDESVQAYGLTDSASKLDLNSATYDQLMLLPGMTDEFASAIIDWRDSDDDITGSDGAEDSYYLALDHPYHVKSSPFETVDELWLVRGATPEILYGSDLNHNDTIEPSELDQANTGVSFQDSARGVLSYVTVYSSKATNATTTQASTDTTVTPPADVNSNTRPNTALQTVLQTYLPARAQAITQLTQTQRQASAFTSIFNWAVRAQVNSQELAEVYPYITFVPAAAAVPPPTAGTATTAPASQPAGKVNVNTATEMVLIAVGMSQAEADAVVAYRTSVTVDPTTKSNIAWLMDLVDPTHFTTNAAQGIVDLGSFITGASTGYTADIVTVTKDGRAFRRVRIVVDASSGVPQIIYRQPLTGGGWPLDPEMRASLRAGTGLDGGAAGDDKASRNNGLSLGIK